MTTTDRHFLAVQEALAGRYSLEREVGRGGMGVVYLAHEVALDRPVALKLLPSHLSADPSLRDRFLREARTAAKLSHPHIVPIHAVDEVGGFVYFAMAYVDGETLGQRIRNRGPLPTAEAARVLREVAWALAYAHAQGVVHRDVKPDNILIETGTGRALVTDFGIAAVMVGAAATADGAEGTRTSGHTGATIGVIGTPEFMSPEQATGEPVDGRSDLYALGCVGYYALSGRLPFEGPTAPSVLAKHVTLPAPPLAGSAPEAPARLARAIDRCLAKAPDERFATGEALAEALAEGTAGRGELPVPLRVFLKRCRETYQGTGAVAVAGFLFLIPTAGAMLSGHGVFATGWAFAGLALLSAPFVSVLHQARKLAKAGYGLPDLRLALRQDVAEREEELRFEFGPNASRLATVSRPIMWMAAVTGTLTAVAAVVVPDLVGIGVWQVVGGAAAVFGGSGIIVARDDTRRKDVWGKRSLKLWQSRIGGWMHRLVTGGALRRAVPTGVTHRPTELAIGLAADRLYEELPKAVRAEVPDLPAVVRRLEADAQAVRARIEELTGLLAELGRERTGAAADGKAELRTRLEGERVAAEAQLRDTVTALETIRLNLLRLHAGVGNIASVTANLEAAREVSDAAARLAEGRREVEKLLGG